MGRDRLLLEGKSVNGSRTWIQLLQLVTWDHPAPEAALLKNKGKMIALGQEFMGT